MSAAGGDDTAVSAPSHRGAPAIIDAAVELIDRRGLDELTFVGLAESMGVEPAALYNRLSSIDALRAALTYRAFRELGDSLLSATADRTGDEAVVELARAYRQYAQQHPGLYETLLRALREGDSSVETAAMSIMQMIADLLTPYGLVGDDAVHAARSLRSALHGFVALEVGEGFMLSQDVDESFETLVEILLGGLRDIGDRSTPSS